MKKKNQDYLHLFQITSVGDSRINPTVVDISFCSTMEAETILGSNLHLFHNCNQLHRSYRGILFVAITKPPILDIVQ